MTLSHAFYIDTLEVTVERFKVWVTAGQPPPCKTGTCTMDPGGPYASAMMWDSAWNGNLAGMPFVNSCQDAYGTTINTSTYTQPNNAAFPMNCLDWYRAAAFCFSEGKRLLTEVEWQYVATGQGESLTYPWGNNDPTSCTLAIWGDGTSNGCGFPKNGGSAPAGAAVGGIQDMAGSVAEWIWDYDNGSFPTSPQTDYTGTTIPSDRGDRGGGWASVAAPLRATYRDGTPAAGVYADFGGRCAKTKL